MFYHWFLTGGVSRVCFREKSPQINHLGNSSMVNCQYIHHSDQHHIILQYISIQWQNYLQLNVIQPYRYPQSLKSMSPPYILQCYIIMIIYSPVLFHICIYSFKLFIWLKNFIYILWLWPIEQTDAGVLDFYDESVNIRFNRWYHITHWYIKRVCLGEKIYS